MADFSQPGSDGELPADFHEWRRGVTCTVRPTFLAPLLRGREYRLNVTVRDTAGDNAGAGFAALYDRASRIAHSRVGELSVENSKEQPHTWTMAQAWFEHQIGSRLLCSATITVGICVMDGERFPARGEERPDSAALLRRSGGNPEAFMAKHLDADGERRLDELYVDFGATDPTGDITISYGEYVAAGVAVEFAPIISRAEQRARGYLGPAADPDATLTICRREWTVLTTGKTTDSHIAVVHLFGRL